jgi:hypothetical protein
MNFRPLAAAALLSAGLFTAAHRAAADEPTPQFTPAQLAILQYAYVDFPRQMEAANNDAALAQRTVDVLQQRVAGYRPFRSFHQYGATYSVDQVAQLQLLAAQQDLACINQRQIDLWRQRQAVVAALLQQAP